MSVLVSTESTDFTMSVSWSAELSVGRSVVNRLMVRIELLLRRQKEVQHQAVEDLHGLFQLSPRGRHCGREDLLLPRRPQPRPPVHGADQEDHEAHRCAETRSSL